MIRHKLLIVWGLALLALGGCQLLQEEQTAQELLKRCRTLKLGMTREEVLTIMGSPRNTILLKEDGIVKERLVFPSPRVAAESTQCVITKESNRVEEIICGEGYRVPSKAHQTKTVPRPEALD